MATRGPALAQLRDILSSMKPGRRHNTIAGLSPSLRSALVSYMEMERNGLKLKGPTVVPTTVGLSTLKASGSTRIIVDESAAVAKYKAFMHIKALRIYTCGHADLETAIEKQMILVQMRQALAAANENNPSFWDNSTEIFDICTGVLQKNQTTEERLGLSAHVYIRAGHLLLQNQTITSPVMPLSEVLAVHSRLLRARQTSWQDLRAEWIQLMQSQYHPAGKRKLLPEAEAVADEARAVALQVFLPRAVATATKVLQMEQLQLAKQHRKEQREKMRDMKAAKKVQRATVLVKRQAAKAKEQAWMERKRWWHRKDLTMEDIMSNKTDQGKTGGRV